MTYGLIFMFTLGLGLAGWIRLAPDDPTRWHVALDHAGAPKPGPCAEAVRGFSRGARAACLVEADPQALLTRLDLIALATPRTNRLAGAPGEGRMTWVSRSLLLGFPDYITAEARHTPKGTRLDILSRQRYGNGDWGVNAARLRAWLAQL
jgi:Protein of unknown function (DUF1499)